MFFSFIVRLPWFKCNMSISRSTGNKMETCQGVKTCQEYRHERWMQKVCFQLSFFLRIAAVLRGRGSGSRATYVSRWEVRDLDGLWKGENSPVRMAIYWKRSLHQNLFLAVFVHRMLFTIHCVTWLLNQIACSYAPHLEIAFKGKLELTCLLLS